ncbi:hypothetical protein [Vibrio barjaei]|uniref:hypothetical protein n=1 Tax=Vibrio barjaei TaxID=1676683 RepID=UPI0022840EA1|nr:hypothetical protein [Vibrio barjaei]MCY9870366.1 hypothetical protein [Vibrio barjaei]
MCKTCIDQICSGGCLTRKVVIPNANKKSVEQKVEVVNNSQEYKSKVTIKENESPL